MDDVLMCPVCGREMKYKLLEDFCMHTRHTYACDGGHEKVSVSIEETKYHTTFIYLGDGCYSLTSDNTSCEKAIGRMKLEFDCNKFMEHFYGPSRPTEF